MSQLWVLSILLFWAQLIHGLAVNSSQPVIVEVKFGDVIASGVLNFENTRPCSHTMAPLSRSTMHSLTAPFPNTTTSQTSTVTNPTMLATGNSGTGQFRPSITAIPTINITNSANSSSLPPGPAFTSGGSRGRSGLAQLVESLWLVNQ